MDFTGWVWAWRQVFKGRGYIMGEEVPKNILDVHKPQLIAEGRIKETSKFVAKKAKEEKGDK